MVAVRRVRVMWVVAVRRVRVMWVVAVRRVRVMWVVAVRRVRMMGVVTVRRVTVWRVTVARRIATHLQTPNVTRMQRQHVCATGMGAQLAAILSETYGDVTERKVRWSIHSKPTVVAGLDSELQLVDDAKIREIDERPLIHQRCISVLVSRQSDRYLSGVAAF